MNKHILRQYGLAACSLMLVSALTGCADDAADLPDMPDVEPQREVTEVPLTISLGSDWSIDTDDDSRAAPPGAGDGGEDTSDASKDGVAETGNVDKVRVVAFRRLDADNEKSADDAARAAEPFLYDATNDMVLDVDPGVPGTAADKFGDTANHKVAHGKLKKVYGYEYRVVAIAYSSTRLSSFTGIEKAGNSTFSMPDDESNWFRLVNGGMSPYGDLDAETTFENFKLSIQRHLASNNQESWMDFLTGHTEGLHVTLDGGILAESGNVADIPQLFYGECYAVDDVNKKTYDVIKYSVTDSKGDENKELPVKGILYRGLAKVELRITPYPKTVGILSYDVQWICLMADNVFTTVGLSDYDDFLKPTDAINNAGEMYTALAYCNVKPEENGKVMKVLTAYMLPCKTRLAVRIKTGGVTDIRNAQLTYGNVESYGNGTGIISPDVHDNEFYLRRNHKYILTVSDSEKLIKEHQIK